MRLTRLLPLLSIACMAAGCTSTAVPELAAADGAPTERDSKRVCMIPADEDQQLDVLLTDVNDLRAENGLEPVTLDPTLIVAAEECACDMIEGGFFAHENPITHMGPGDRLTTAGYIFYSMGENLAVGQTSAHEVFDAWMASPDHRDNILDPNWREVGLAVRRGGDYGWYWVQEFADPVYLDEVLAGDQPAGPAQAGHD